MPAKKTKPDTKSRAKPKAKNKTLYKASDAKMPKSRQSNVDKFKKKPSPMNSVPPRPLPKVRAEYLTSLKSGAPTLLTPEIIKIITGHMLKGSFLETACATVGITKTTVMNWLRLGNEALDQEEIPEDKRIYADFVLRINAAAARAELTDLDTVNKAINQGDWKAAAWKMGKRYGAWKEIKVVMKHEGSDENPIKHEHLHSTVLDVDKLPIDKCEKILAILAGEEEIHVPDLLSDNSNVIEGELANGE